MNEINRKAIVLSFKMKKEYQAREGDTAVSSKAQKAVLLLRNSEVNLYAITGVKELTTTLKILIARG